MAHIELSQVRSVYSGKLNACMCGCSGKHYYSTEFQSEATKDRGYEVLPEELSDKMVKRVVNMLNKDPNTNTKEAPGHYAFLNTETRSYVVYFRNRK